MRQPSKFDHQNNSELFEDDASPRKSCDCGEIVILEPETLANYPVDAVLKSIFKIANMVKLENVQQCLELFKN